MENGKIYEIWCKDEYGYTIVGKDNKLNIMRSDGSMLLDTWYDSVHPFKHGYALVINNKKQNFIDTTGKLVSTDWFDDTMNWFNIGFAGVCIDGKWNMLSPEGKYISETWYRHIWVDYESKMITCVVGNKLNFLDKTGKVLSETWFDGAGELYDFTCFCDCDADHDKEPDECKCKKVKDIFIKNFMLVGLNKKYNFINRQGKLMSNVWFEKIDYTFTIGYFIMTGGEDIYVFDGERVLKLEKK